MLVRRGVKLITTKNILRTMSTCNLEAEFIKYKSSIPAFANDAYQKFMCDAKAAQTYNTSQEANTGLALNEESKKKVEAMGRILCKLTDLEALYLQILLEDGMSKRDKLHPLILTLDSNNQVSQQGDEYPHPVNFFLQQEAMRQLWEGRASVGFGGGAAAGAQGKVAEEEAPKEEIQEKTAFEVVITAIDDAQKMKIIKEAKNILGLGLKEAKVLVESLPAILQKDVKKEDGEKLAEKFIALGCTVEIK